jgi:mannose-6-phosphate isomerase-like protein (cupin superfamily)
MHEAASDQLLLVVEGAGRVRTADGETAEIAAGEGVLWTAGEQHQTTTERGLRAVVVEGKSLELL